VIERPSRVQTVRFELAPKSIGLVVATLAGLWLVGQLSAIVVLLVCALILVGTLNPFVAWLEKRRVRRSLALALVFFTSLSVMGLLSFITFPPLWEQLTRLAHDLPSLQSRLAQTLDEHQLTAGFSDPVRNFAAGKALHGLDVMSAVTMSLDVVEIVGYAATALVLAVYFIADRERMRGGLYAVVPRTWHVRLARVLANLETIVGGYMRGQVITSVAIAAFTFTLLTICHVPDALALAAFAGLTDVLPFVGGLLATTPAVLASLSQGTVTASVVLVLMVGYQEFESRVLVPRVYGRTLRLPSAAVILALLVGGKLGGVLGALLALPLAAALRMLAVELRLDLPGDDTDDPLLRARDAQAEQDYARQSAGSTPEQAGVLATGIADQILHEDAATAAELETPAPGTAAGAGQGDPEESGGPS
jgi:predicted PurR-regulated permease PerM